jgi:hypothetical protein
MAPVCDLLKEGGMKHQKAFIGVFISLAVLLLGMGISGGDELLEPTRNLGGPEKQWGGLTLFSEPPQMDVYMDGQKIGRTPLWLRQVEAKNHDLKIGEIETNVQVKKGKTVRIGLFKQSLVKFTEVEQLAAPSETTKKSESQRPSRKDQSKKQKKEDLSLWERYINGSIKHF